jgi:hypothetical protein
MTMTGRLLLTRALHGEKGVETVEYLGLGAIVVILGGAVYLYVAGGISQITTLIGALIERILAGFAQGW